MNRTGTLYDQAEREIAWLKMREKIALRRGFDDGWDARGLEYEGRDYRLLLFIAGVVIGAVAMWN